MKVLSRRRPKCPVLVLVLVTGSGGLFAVANLAPAQNWTPTSAPNGRWRSVATSADGIKLVAAGVTRCCIDVEVPLPIYVSADSGTTWTQTSTSSNYWSSVACSADGTKLVAAAGAGQSYDSGDGLIYTSTNSGATWTQTTAPSNNWTSVACSADGTKLVAASGDFGSGLIYTSTNSGATWVPTTAPMRTFGLPSRLQRIPRTS